jgi:radical SAM protein with 4Fe4S-binding SPASM domain
MQQLKGRWYAPRIAYTDWRSLNLFSMMRAGQDLLPAPAFYHCEANIDLTCFDQDGHLYACYETIGDPKFAVGRFWPEISIDQAHLSQYRDRSAFSMDECTDCAMSPVCGGGCEVRGYKKTGAYMHPYCDDLHAETRLVLRNWRDVSQLLTGSTHES